MQYWGKFLPDKKGHEFDMKYLQIPDIFPQYHTLFDAILAKNNPNNFDAKLLLFDAKREGSHNTTEVSEVANKVLEEARVDDSVTKDKELVAVVVDSTIFAAAEQESSTIDKVSD